MVMIKISLKEVFIKYTLIQTHAGYIFMLRILVVNTVILQRNVPKIQY